MTSIFDAQAIVTALAPRLRGLLADPFGLPVVTSDRVATADDSGLVMPADQAADTIALGELLDGYRRAHGQAPTVVVVPGVARLGVGPDLPAARHALAEVPTGAGNGPTGTGPAGAGPTGIELTSTGPNGTGPTGTGPAAGPARAPEPSREARPQGRLTGKIALVTGAAQGFGLGLAQEILHEGGTVVLADLNVDLATTQAAALEARHGEGRAIAVRMDVSDEQSCLDAVAEVVAIFGGCDLFVSNAGVLRADGVMTQPVADFDLVTDVNYRGYFLGVRAVAPVMAAQREGVRLGSGREVWFDIVEINSKSGLEGSKRNFAYAGSKFGGIGLTQSFALELVEHGIKVNAICPGNYLDGPLWSDPERGLFVQYLRAGKVPGATTIEDVRRFYEAKVPMNRGCLPSDVAKALFYIVEQTYETGQAVPVTGGQNMLS